MSRYIHQIVGYGVGALSCAALGFAVDRQAQALPFASRVHATPLPAHSHLVDQRTVGGQAVARDRYCAAKMRLLIQSDLPLRTLASHYKAHPVPAAHGMGATSGHVRPVRVVEGLQPEWRRHLDDPKLFVVEFVSPGTPGAEAACAR